MFSKFWFIYFCNLKFAIAVDTPTSSAQAPPSRTVESVQCTTIPNGRYYPAHRYCTPVPGLSESGDDAPAIQAAIDKAGTNYGFVWLPENQTYTIKSPIRWSKMEWVGLYIAGKLKIGGTERDWENASAIMSIDSVQKWHLQGAGSSMIYDGPKIRGQGVIDGSELRWNSSTRAPPALFHLTKSHYIHPRDVVVNNAPGTYFRLEDVSHIDSSTIRLTTDEGYGRNDTFGILLGNAEYVFFNGVEMYFNEKTRTGHCVTVDSVPSHGISIANIKCRNAVTGVTVMLGASSTSYRIGNVVVATHVTVKNLTVDAGIATGILNQGKYQNVMVSEVKYDNITVLGGETAVIEDCWQAPGQSALPGCALARRETGTQVSRSYTEIHFLNYFGKIGSPPKERTGDVVIGLNAVNWTKGTPIEQPLLR
jgi:hypothetical protein